MKALTGYFAIICVSLMLAAIAAKGMTPSNETGTKTSIRANLEARKAALEAI